MKELISRKVGKSYSARLSFINKETKRNDEAGNKKSTIIISDKRMILSESLHECSSQRDNEYKTSKIWLRVYVIHY